jgi:hypothetical protein
MTTNACVCVGGFVPARSCGRGPTANEPLRFGLQHRRMLSCGVRMFLLSCSVHMFFSINLAERRTSLCLRLRL